MTNKMTKEEKRILIIGLAIIGLTVLLEALFVHPHGHYWYHKFFSFDLFFGLIGCLLLILFAKIPLKSLVERDENYYGGGESNDD